MTFRIAGIAVHTIEMCVYCDTLRDIDGFFRQPQRSPQEGVASAGVNQPTSTHLAIRKSHAPTIILARDLLRTAALAHLATATRRVIEQHMIEFCAFNLERLSVPGHQSICEPESLPTGTIPHKKLGAEFWLESRGLNLRPRAGFLEHIVAEWQE